MIRSQEEVRDDLVKVEHWANEACHKPETVSPMARKLLEVNRYQLLKELLAAQLREFNHA